MSNWPGVACTHTASEESTRMLANGLKHELDALAGTDFRYLTKMYLPRKVKDEEWLD